jgi:hypothetical protein
VDNQIKADWRNEVKIENKDEKTKALRFGAFMADQYKSYGIQALDDHLPFDELRTLKKFINVMKIDLNLEIEVMF